MIAEIVLGCVAVTMVLAGAWLGLVLIRLGHIGAGVGSLVVGAVIAAIVTDSITAIAKEVAR